MKILGVFFGLGCLCAGAFAQCPPPEGAQREVARLERVHDGDTLHLTDGRRIRLLGVNTPELASSGQVAEALAVEARAAANAFFDKGKALELVYDLEPRDRYGRTLAHVYSVSGQSLEAELLARGLAFHIAVPPNLILADCLAAQEAKARRKGLGVWSHADWQPRPASGMRLSDAGFQRVSGRVTEVDIGGDVWLELDGPLVVKIPESDRVHFKGTDWQSWLGRELQLRGWVIDRSNSTAARRGFKPLVMLLRSPHGLIEFGELDRAY